MKPPFCLVGRSGACNINCRRNYPFPNVGREVATMEAEASILLSWVGTRIWCKRRQTSCISCLRKWSESCKDIWLVTQERVALHGAVSLTPTLPPSGPKKWKPYCWIEKVLLWDGLHIPACCCDHWEISCCNCNLFPCVITLLVA